MLQKASLSQRLAAVFGLGVLACTARVEPGGEGTPVQPPEIARASDSSSSSPTPSDQGATTTMALSWSGGVGSWCGPLEKQTLWLNARPQAVGCDGASRQVYGSATVDTSEGLTLELDAPALAAIPTTLHVPARYCAASGHCSNVTATLDVTSFAPDQGLRGHWSLQTPEGAALSGDVDASWCHWDDYLPAHPEAERLARDIVLREVSFYQGVKVPVVEAQRAVQPRNADLVQGREALVRVFVDPLPGFVARPLSARLTLQDEGQRPRIFEQAVEVKQPSSETDGASTFNLELPKDALGPTTQFAVELREISRCTPLSGSATAARFPEQGLAPVGARRTGPVKVLLVPVRYEADGSGRLPELTPERVLEMSRRLYAMYPTTEVMISVRSEVRTDRTDLGDMLDQVRELRVSDAPPSDLAYYGMVQQTETFKEYCLGSCTMGLAGFGSMSGTAATGMGVAYPETAAATFVHELGHIYRRPHAPCGNPAAPDASFPYPDGKLGAWGYDAQNHELFDPSTHFDFMGYCGPEWISDYNYQQLLERIVVVNQRAFARRLDPNAPHHFRTLRVSAGGVSKWGLDLRPQGEPPGDPVKLEALDAAGAVIEEARAYVEASPDGETAYFVPAGHAAWHAIRAPGGVAVPYGEPTDYAPFDR